MVEFEDRIVADGLAALRHPAPADLADQILEELGLTDAYVKVEGPIGPLFVAYGARGIALVERAGDPGEFEEQFLSTFGRPVHRIEKAPELIERIIDARVWGKNKNQVRIPLNLEQLPDF